MSEAETLGMGVLVISLFQQKGIFMRRKHSIQALFRYFSTQELYDASETEILGTRAISLYQRYTCFVLIGSAPRGHCADGPGHLVCTRVKLKTKHK